MKIIKIKDKNIVIYDEFDGDKELPIVFYHTFEDDGEKLWEECKRIGCDEFILVVIKDIKWNDELTPYPILPPFKGEEPYLGKADSYIKYLVEEAVPEIAKKLKCKPKYYVNSGYSLAGLFSIYSMYKTSLFTRFISGSGSLWYPDFSEFVEENSYLKKPEKIYFSLGKKEKNSKNKTLATVEDKTIKICDYFKNLGINVFFEFNEGGHFADENERIAKGIKWILKD